MQLLKGHVSFDGIIVCQSFRFRRSSGSICFPHYIFTDMTSFNLIYILVEQKKCVSGSRECNKGKIQEAFHQLCALTRFTVCPEEEGQRWADKKGWH